MKAGGAMGRRQESIFKKSETRMTANVLKQDPNT